MARVSGEKRHIVAWEPAPSEVNSFRCRSDTKRKVMSYREHILHRSNSIKTLHRTVGRKIWADWRLSYQMINFNLIRSAANPRIGPTPNFLHQPTTTPLFFHSKCPWPRTIGLWSCARVLLGAVTRRLQAQYVCKFYAAKSLLLSLKHRLQRSLPECGTDRGFAPRPSKLV